jgi:hypothetical protein
MNKDQVKGRIEKAKGKVRELAGMIPGNRTLEKEGRIGKNARQRSSALRRSQGKPEERHLIYGAFQHGRRPRPSLAGLP